MPANVSIDFEKAKHKYEQARTQTEKLIALQEMRSFAPKHKGAENLRAEIVGRIAKLRKEMEKQKTEKAKRGSAQTMQAKKEGIGQIVLAGLPNSGKSTVLNALTGANAEIASYEFTTRNPEKGMLQFEEIQIQLVEAPAIVQGSSSGKANGFQVLSLVRNADAIVLVLNSDNALHELGVLEKEFENAGIFLNRERPQIEVKRTSFPGISISGKHFLKIPEEEFIRFLKDIGYKNSEVVIKEPTNLETLALALDEKACFKKCLIMLTRENVSCTGQLEKDFSGKILWFSQKNLAEIKKEIFALLGRIRVFTKKPGKKPDYKNPLVLKEGSTIEDATRMLHKDLAKRFKYAKVWGSAKFEGQRVGKDYKLKDKDVIEVYA